MAVSDVELFSSLRYDPLLKSISENTKLLDHGDKESSPFYMLAYHRDRILQAAEHFKYDKAIGVLQGPQGLDNILQKLNEAIDVESSGPLRVRVVVDDSGNIRVETNSIVAVTEETLYPARLPPPNTPAPKVSPLTGGALIIGDDDSVHGDPPTANPWDVMPDPKQTPPSSYTSYKTVSRDMYNSARERVGIKNPTEKKEVLLIADDSGETMEGSLTTPYFWRNGTWTTPPVSSGGQIGTTRRWALEKGYVKFCCWTRS